jgi:putative transposase
MLLPILLFLLFNPRFLADHLIRLLARVLILICLHSRPRPVRCRGWRRPPALARGDDAVDSLSEPTHGRRKPDWVRREVLRLAVFLVSCRTTANAFNRLYGQRMTVSHGFVHELCRANQALLAHRRRAMRRRPPLSVPRNATWAMDLTQLPMVAGAKVTVLGLIDHGTRRVLCLRAVANKCTWTLLGHLCLAIAEHGKPRTIRTDNEGMFTGPLWQRALRWAGIRRQRIDPGCPWQNGRIERFFGTTKEALRGLIFPGQAVAQQVLDEFAGFYNHARPHRGLGALTPMEAWRGETRQDVKRKAGCGQWVQSLNGRLVAYHLRL